MLRNCTNSYFLFLPTCVTEIYDTAPSAMTDLYISTVWVCAAFACVPLSLVCRFRLCAAFACVPLSLVCRFRLFFLFFFFKGFLF